MGRPRAADAAFELIADHHHVARCSRTRRPVSRDSVARARPSPRIVRNFDETAGFLVPVRSPPGQASEHSTLAPDAWATATAGHQECPIARAIRGASRRTATSDRHRGAAPAIHDELDGRRTAARHPGRIMRVYGATASGRASCARGGRALSRPVAGTVVKSRASRTGFSTSRSRTARSSLQSGNVNLYACLALRMFDEVLCGWPTRLPLPSPLHSARSGAASGCLTGRLPTRRREYCSGLP